MTEKNSSNTLFPFIAKNYNELENIIQLLISDAQLNQNNNLFFIHAASKNKFSINAAYKIAYNWQEITKTFLFSTIKGLGSLAEEISKNSIVRPELLSVLQTGFSIISDDLSNNHFIFNEKAPSGPNGAHYKWWEETIVKPLSLFVNEKVINLSPGTNALIKKMQCLSMNYLGVAVQLRVVEAIALDICKAFLAIFSNIEYQNKKVFDDKKDLTWITSHIKAEEIHHAQVCDDVNGMAAIATSLDEQKELLALTREYTRAWIAVLEDFATIIEIT